MFRGFSHKINRSFLPFFWSKSALFCLNYGQTRKHLDSDKNDVNERPDGAYILCKIN